MRAPTVLLAWELGGGMGHARPLLHLARALADDGFRPVLAFRDLIEPAPLLREVPFPVLAVPAFPGHLRPAPPNFLARGYADLLAVNGFTDGDALTVLVRGWQDLLNLVDPALVIADHSPTLCLAAWGRTPVVQVGNGFFVPPAEGDVFPPLLPEVRETAPADQLLAVMRQVCERRGQPAPATLTEPFRTAGRFVTVLPELDPYRDHRPELAIGPVEEVGPPLPPPTPEAGFFAYLSTSLGGCAEVLLHLAATGVPGRVYVRGADAALTERLRQAGLEVLDRPLPLEQVLGESAVIVHHGSTGLTQAALAAGRPQFCFPEHLEHLLNARRLHQLGTAHYLFGTFPTADIAEGLRQLRQQPAFLRRARAVADDLHARGPRDPLPAIRQRCRELTALAGSAHEMKAVGAG